MRTFLLIALLLLLPSMLPAQNPSDETALVEDEEPLGSSTEPVQLSFKNRPSLRIGEIANVDVKTKWHLDFLGFDPPKWDAPAKVTALPSTPPTFYLTRARVGLKGKVTKYFDYEVERWPALRL